ncbi:MAG: glycosyltransferase, partial [Eggerthellaceae bacterium]|nr:glycosyltransferase [Eggerthellaceae bacterium]
GIVSKPKETGNTFAENSKIKARAAWEAAKAKGIKVAVLADDSGLIVDCLGGAPGVYSSRYGGKDGDDVNNNQVLLKNIEKAGAKELKNRKGRFVCSLCFIDEGGSMTCVDGKMEGRIGFKLQGRNGFGYDPLFLSEAYGFKKTNGQIRPEQKARISHRGNALRKLRDTLHAEVPFVSVIIPIFNAEETLGDALLSVRDQSLRNIEIICVNDGSADSSLRTIRKHAADDDRIVIIDKKNEGYGASMNRGMNVAHGLYLGILEPDDYINRYMLEDMWNFANKFDQLPEIVKTPYNRIILHDSINERITPCVYAHGYNFGMETFTINQAPNLLNEHPSIWSSIYLRSFLEEHEIRFREIPGAGWADNPFMVDTLCRAKHIAFLNRPYYYYREDTPEEEKDFYRKNYRLPFERWHDMVDVLDALGVRDDGIRAAINRHGFTYIADVLSANERSEEIEELVLKAYERMDAKLVFDDPRVPPQFKADFARLRKIDKAKYSKLSYYRVLAAKGINTLRHNGYKNLIYTLKKYLNKY